MRDLKIEITREQGTFSVSINGEADEFIAHAEFEKDSTEELGSWISEIVEEEFFDHD